MICRSCPDPRLLSPGVCPGGSRAPAPRSRQAASAALDPGVRRPWPPQLSSVFLWSGRCHPCYCQPPAGRV